MADTLRDRIAAVLASTVCTLAENNPCAECIEPELPVADLLIRELGLQTRLAERIINGKPDKWVRRYATDWEIVD